jgi:hypothetical protein
LYKTSFIIVSEKGNLLEIPYWIITKKYDSTLGLIFAEQEEWKAELL